jgi:3-hydroxyisobutyrate dehydrogenase
MKDKKMGWVGLGKMGQPMSGQLINAGYPVYVYSRNEAAKQLMAARGAVVLPSLQALTNEVDVLFLMVPDNQAIENIFKSETGILSASLTGKTIVNMSTVSPDINREMAALCKAKGGSFLDAPVSGSIKQAEDAKLVIMVGGESSVYETIRPIFDILGSTSTLLGDTGSGNVAKLAANILLGIEAQGLAEVINFAENNGISPDAILSVINNGVLGSILMKLKGELIITGNYKPAFALTQIAKDLRLAKAEGMNSPLGNAVYETYQEAETQFGNEDIIAVKKHLQLNATNIVSK